MNDIEGILIECAKLRGTEYLMNRTLQEFNWFVQSAMFKGHIEDSEGDTIYINYHHRMSCESGELFYWALLFREYCQKRYGDKK